MSLFAPVLMLFIALVGVVTNCLSVLVFVRQKFRRNFHRLLIMLAAYDLLVVIFCSMLYCLNSIWPAYKSHFPYIAPYLLPMVHIALMSSVYCTVVMSWERYIRIVLISNLVNCTYLSRGKFRAYLATIIIFPILFYLPKFYEVSIQRLLSFTMKCSFQSEQ
ncbi:hypothetical protein TCAL_15554 [Tigriopus californicus]|uniref:G-protein coupled receptors family 1 profile domain-containing protein n=1 Tax=Tigriopus californicus TaxID=6832 RepID=A0A553PAI7_TIGCA|nr:hypothetical protein TCAL_15554 [Tigriopus californicus]